MKARGERKKKWVCVSGVNSSHTKSWQTQQRSPCSSLGLEEANLALRQPRELLTEDDLGRSIPGETDNWWPDGCVEFWSKSKLQEKHKLKLRLSLQQPNELHFFHIWVYVVVQSLSHVWLCDPTDCSAPGFPVLHCLLEFTQIHVHWVGDALQPSHPPWHPFPPDFYLLEDLSGSFPTSQLFTSDGQSIGASALASALSMTIHGWFPLGLTDLISCYPKGFSIVFSSITIWKYNFLALSLLYGPTLTSVHDYWKNTSFDYTDLCWKSDVSAF